MAASSLATACLTTDPADLAGPADLESTSRLIPPDLPQLCEMTPSCSLSPSTFTHPLQPRLGCGGTHEYFNGYSGGFMGGIGSFCPDSAATRATLRAAHVAAYRPGFCTQCLHVPEGMLFVFWTQFQGPGCPSSCNPGAPPAQL